MRRLLATILLLVACDQPVADPCFDFIGEPDGLTSIDGAIVVTYPDDHPAWAPAPARIDALLFRVLVDEQDGGCPVASMDDVMAHVALDVAQESPSVTHVACIPDGRDLQCCAWELPEGASAVVGDTYVDWARDACSLPSSWVIDR